MPTEPAQPEMVDQRRRIDPPTWAPVPDPTHLTEQLVDREIMHLKELFNVQFQLIERQRVESKIDTEKALAAALASQEKAAGVLATFTADQLKALQVSFTTSTDQIRKDIGELKETASSTMGNKQGGNEARTAIYAITGFIVALIAIGSTVFGVSKITSSGPTVVTVPTPVTTVAR